MRKQKLSKIILLAVGLITALPAFADSPQAGFKGDSGGAAADSDITDLAGFPSGIGQANKVVGIDAAGTAYERKTLTGTANRVTVTHGVGSVTFSAPQDLHTAAKPTWAGSILSAALEPSSAGGTTLGVLLLPFSSIYIGNAATNNIQITGTATGSRVFTLPDASITAAGINNANNFSTAQLPSAFGTIDLGSTARPWKDIYLANGGANYSILRSASLTGNRTVTFPDADSNTVQPLTALASNWVRFIDSTGLQTRSQPAFSDISGVATIANGGTNNGSLGVSAVGIYNGDGSKVEQTTAGALQSWRVNAGGTDIEAYTPSAAGISFGGNGADGTGSFPVTISNGVRNYSNVTISAAVTVDTTDTCWIKATGTLDISDAVTYTAGSGWKGGTAPPAASQFAGWKGSGLGGGQSPGDLGNGSAGGGGGGNGTRGGRGGNASSASGFPTAGGMNYNGAYPGSGGSSASSGAGGSGGAGGNGGGLLVFASGGAMTDSTGAAVTNNGANGTAGVTQCGGGSGGAGGTTVFASETTVVLDLITSTASGGNGAASAGAFSGGGGAGGAGKNIAIAPTTPTVTGTFTAADGSAGAGGGSGQAGEDPGLTFSVLAITATPTIPLIVEFKNPDNIRKMDMLQRMHYAMTGDGVHLGQREVISALAGNNLQREVALYGDLESTATACDAEAVEVIKSWI